MFQTGVSWQLCVGLCGAFWRRGETDPPQGATMHSWGVPLLSMELGQQSVARQQRAQKPTAEQTVEDSYMEQTVEDRTWAEEAKPQGSSDFLPPWDPEGTVKTSLQCKSLFKKQLSYWSKTRCRTKGFHYKETVSREDFFIKHFLFLISLILSFVCFKIFILAHVVMQPFSKACKIHHGSWGSCSEKQVRTNPHPGTGQPMQILMTSRQSGSSFRRSRISDEETNY